MSRIAESDWDLNPSDIARRWRRRPVLHALASLFAAAPMGRLVLQATTTGISSVLVGLGGVALGVAGVLALVVLFDGPWRAEPVAWTDETVSGFAIRIPPEPRIAADGVAQAGVTAWVGWFLALATVALALGSQGLLTSQMAFGLGMFATWLAVPTLWMAALIPSWVGASPLPSLAGSGSVVRVEARQLRVGDRTFGLGRGGQRFELVDDSMLLTNDDERLVIEGSRLHLAALRDRLVRFAGAGSREDVPESLEKVRPNLVSEAQD